MYANLEGEWIKKNWKKLNENAKETFDGLDDKDTDSLLYDKEEDKIMDVEFNEGKLVFDISNSLGFFRVGVDIDDKLAFEILERLKEKGRKIRRLIGLGD